MGLSDRGASIEEQQHHPARLARDGCARWGWRPPRVGRQLWTARLLRLARRRVPVVSPVGEWALIEIGW